ncbi:hypothetical protein GCM10007301_52400 [Azorhizobium oxalatiphilum]|uniref:Uncharacterized protein n=1 Tax=Azorhizobium oxalatiphilum TaxID=980631 RepID=A0A917FK88_9HYPH|nr:hypothetical protein [Azorhizobium oxalatiphilum]GGF86038.1 hypothetical protein GCM10007301_52400 [Azorhizobium oxalatiphilum]
MYRAVLIGVVATLTVAAFAPSASADEYVTRENQVQREVSAEGHLLGARGFEMRMEDNGGHSLFSPGPVQRPYYPRGPKGLF